MKREIIITEDGSTTIYLPDWNEHYHSTYGAIQEAYHVFIEMGFFFSLKNQQPIPLKILEIGFGTGLNSYITLLESKKLKINIEYTGVEAYPITISEVEKLNYPLRLKASETVFNKLHTTKWEQSSEISKNFILIKRNQFFSEINDKNKYHIIYFDAFGPNVQPELWTEEIFEKMYKALAERGVLVTYSAKGSVRRAMQSVGFSVDRIPGPPGKREMLRGIKH